MTEYDFFFSSEIGTVDPNEPGVIGASFKAHITEPSSVQSSVST
jgi:hypothetical protein